MALPTSWSRLIDIPVTAFALPKASVAAVAAALASILAGCGGGEQQEQSAAARAVGPLVSTGAVNAVAASPVDEARKIALAEGEGDVADPEAYIDPAERVSDAVGEEPSQSVAGLAPADLRKVALSATPTTLVIGGRSFDPVPCAREGQTCTLSRPSWVAYGASGQFSVKESAGLPVLCHNGTFGDPVKGKAKSCHVSLAPLDAAPPAPPAPPPAANSPAPVPTEWTRGDVSADPRVSAMLGVWNKPDAQGMACVHCHASPQAVEFALAGVQPQDIERRGLPHHSASDIQAVKSGVQRLSELLGLPTRQRDSVFLLQPGGRPVEGLTYYERDWNFVRTEVARLTPTFLKRIDDVPTALRAIAEFQAVVDGSTYRIPARSPLYSGDTFRSQERGEATGTIHKWISFAPIQPVNAAAASRVEAARKAYIAQPDNSRFYAYYRAVEQETAAFGKPDSFFNQPLAVKQIDMNLQAAKYEKSKYLSALLAFHVELQQALGMRTLLDAGRDALRRPGEKLGFAQFPVFNPFQTAGDDTGAPIGAHRLEYPVQVTRSLPGALAASKNTVHGNTVTYHARQGAPAWWAYSITYDPLRFGASGAYWIADFLEFGSQTFNNGRPPAGTSRDSGIEGYPGFLTWSLVRGDALAMLKLPGSFEFPKPVLRADILQLSGLNNPEGWANEAHRQALLTMGLNSVKMAMASYIDHVNSRHAQGRAVDQAKTQRILFEIQIEPVLQLARLSADPAELASLVRLHAQWKQAVRESYAWPLSAHRLPGSGDGLLMRTFDAPGFAIPTGTSVARQVDFHNYPLPADSLFTIGAVFKAHAGQSPRSPIVNVGAKGYSIVWEGQVMAPFTDSYDFFVHPRSGAGPTTNEVVRVWVNGVQTFSYTQGSPTRLPDSLHEYSTRVDHRGSNMVRVPLVAGQRYNIRIEMERLDSEQFHAVLFWGSEKHQPVEVVPQQYLFSGR